MKFFAFSTLLVAFAVAAYGYDAEFNDQREELNDEIQKLGHALRTQLHSAHFMYDRVLELVDETLRKYIATEARATIDIIRDLNETSLLAWEERAREANVSVRLCVKELERLNEATLDIMVQVQTKVNDAATNEKITLRKLQEQVSTSVYDELFQLEDKVNECPEGDKICLDIVKSQVDDDWNQLPLLVNKGVEKAASWLTDNTFVEDIQVLIARFENNEEVIVKHVVNCIENELINKM